MPRLPEMTSVMLPVTRVPAGTTTRPLTETLEATVASNESPGRAVFDDRSEESATVSGVPAATSTSWNTGFGGALAAPDADGFDDIAAWDAAAFFAAATFNAASLAVAAFAAAASASFFS